MKRFAAILLFCALACITHAFAQDNKIKVKDFYLNEFDNTANTHGTIVYDENNGEKCALIKIRTNVEGFSFNAGFLGIAKTEQKIGEIWVYVPQGVKKLTISHPTLATLEYSFPTGQVQRARTYVMELDANEVFDQVVEDDTKRGTLKFNVTPKNAHVIVNAVPLILDTAGHGEANLYYGRYTYKVTAENHYPFSGRVRINQEKQVQTLDINLKQNYGWLKVDCPEGLDEATFYIDGMKLENPNPDSIVVKSGRRTLRIVNPLYIPLEEEIDIQDSTVTNYPTRLISNYGTVDLVADSISNIYANGKFLGKGSWSGRLPAGQQTIECRAESHESSFLQITVVKDAPVTKYMLVSPTPIYGSLEIGTTPQGADVYLNEELIGTTGTEPLVKHRVLIGKKNLTIRAENFSTIRDTVTIVKDSTARRNYTLGNKVFVTIRSLPDSSRIYLDGKEMGTTPFADTLNAGSHNLKIMHSRKYAPVKKRIYIDSDNSSFTYTLKEDLVRKNEFYFAGIIGYGHGLHYGGAAGFYLNNFNLEGGVTFGTESEKIYWNPVNNETASTEITTYSPMNIWGKIGIGIHASSKIRITPQAGIQFTTLKEKTAGGGTGDQSNCMSAILGCRFAFAIANAVGFSFTPEYRFGVSSSDGYSTLAALSQQIDGYNKGFNAKLGLYFFF